MTWALRGHISNQFSSHVYDVCELGSVDFCAQYGKHARTYALSTAGLSGLFPDQLVAESLSALCGFPALFLIVSGIALECYRRKVFGKSPKALIQSLTPVAYEITEDPALTSSRDCISAPFSSSNSSSWINYASFSSAEENFDEFESEPQRSSAVLVDFSSSHSHVLYLEIFAQRQMKRPRYQLTMI